MALLSFKKTILFRCTSYAIVSIVLSSSRQVVNPYERQQGYNAICLSQQITSKVHSTRCQASAIFVFQTLCCFFIQNGTGPGPRPKYVLYVCLCVERHILHLWSTSSWRTSSLDSWTVPRSAPQCSFSMKAIFFFNTKSDQILPTGRGTAHRSSSSLNIC